MFQIVRNGKWGFMDRTGRVVIAPAFADERDFFRGLAAVRMPEGKWGFIDETGKLPITPRFDEARESMNGVGCSDYWPAKSRQLELLDAGNRNLALLFTPQAPPQMATD